MIPGAIFRLVSFFVRRNAAFQNEPVNKVGGLLNINQKFLHLIFCADVWAALPEAEEIVGQQTCSPGAPRWLFKWWRWWLTYHTWEFPIADIGVVTLVNCNTWELTRGATESLFLYFPGQDNFLSLFPCRRQKSWPGCYFWGLCL